MEEITRVGVGHRIDRRGNIAEVSFFEYILRADRPLPLEPRELTHLGSAAAQVMFAGFGPKPDWPDWFYSTLFFLLEDAECHNFLVEEIRNAFKSYNDITPAALTSLRVSRICITVLRNRSACFQTIIQDCHDSALVL
jgi:hypothetical protein